MYDFSADPNLSDFEKVVLSSGKLRKNMKAAQKFIENGEWDKAIPHLLTLWKAMPEDPDILLVMSHALVNLGVREEAIGVIKQYLLHHKPTATICGIIMSLANAMEIFSVAEKIGKILLEMQPGDPSVYCDYIMVLARQAKYDEAIEVCQSIIPIFKNHSELWNVLGAAVQYRDGFDKAIVFYEEALRLNPNSMTALHNISMAAEMVGGYNSARQYLERAYEISPTNTEINMGLAFCKFWSGELDAKTWENYSHRLSPTRSNAQHIHYTHKLPAWNGENLDEKTIFATCEQGIGDEVMFGNILPRLYENAEKLIIGVDHRLISLMQRRFPNAIVGGYGDHVRHGYRYRTFHDIQKRMNDDKLKIDYACTFASIPAFYWTKTENVKPEPIPLFISDPERRKDFASRIAEKTDKPLVGLAWTSGNKSTTRIHLYPSAEEMEAIFDLKDQVSFINLQYGDVADDIRLFKETYDVEIIDFEDVDLRSDIEANIAIMDCCDLVISVTSAPAQFAIATGVKSIIMSLMSSIWWAFGKKTTIPFAQENTTWVIHGDNENKWDKIIPNVAAKAKEVLNLND